jgi:DNA-binding PadR family transcriptional regulator
VGTPDDRTKEIQRRTLASVRRLRYLDLSPLEAEILDRLIDGRRTAVELVGEIYGLGRGDESYDASCVRVRRALRRLERRGLASTRIFGRDRPYRVTRHGVAVLASIAPEMGEPRILGWPRIALLAATALCGLVMVSSTRVFEGCLGDWGELALFASFFFLSGLSVSVLVDGIRRVF